MLFLVVFAFTSVVAALATPNERFFDSRNGHAHAAKSLIFPSDSDLYLESHNTVRLFHGAVGLVWNDTLADAASGWAQTCQVSHSDGTLLNGTPYGENIVAGTGHFPIATAMNQFTLDESDYTSGSELLNHFTQVVWQSSKQLGCAMASCDGLFDSSLGSASYYVCLYYPPGNVIGQAAVNVQA
ncbi:CAP domain-containing protein [Mycena sanguinolenta]|nr:CAP domain-containing protein [Mycena sanguinolenta]